MELDDILQIYFHGSVVNLEDMTIKECTLAKMKKGKTLILSIFNPLEVIKTRKVLDYLAITGQYDYL